MNNLVRIKEKLFVCWIALRTLWSDVNRGLNSRYSRMTFSWIVSPPQKSFTAQNVYKKSSKDFFSKCDQIRRNLRILSHLLKKYLMENLDFRAVLSVFCKDFAVYLFHDQFSLQETRVRQVIHNWRWKLFISLFSRYIISKWGIKTG